MATNVFQNITARGTRADFTNVMEGLPNVWEKYVTRVPSDAPDEEHTWMGMLPKPKEFLGEHEWQGILDFTFNVPNKTYEMSFLIDRESMEDDRHGQINKRISDAAEAWGTFKDEQFKDLLEDNTTDSYDGTAFFADTRTIGLSANIDNNLADTWTDAANPTATEFLDSVKLIRDNLFTFEDDQARTAYNGGAMRQTRLLIPPKYEKGAVEAMRSTVIANTSNPYGSGLSEIDVLAYLTPANNIFFTGAVGATRMPFIYQERTPLEITVINNQDDVVINNGVLVVVRQRYRLQYGEFRRMVKMSLS